VLDGTRFAVRADGTGFAPRATRSAEAILPSAEVGRDERVWPDGPDGAVEARIQPDLFHP
jgi:hypothetical protein